MITASTKTTETVHSELYREYLITVEMTPAETTADDVFELGLVLPERYQPLVDGCDSVYAGTLTKKGDAVVAAKRWVDSILLHPLTGRTLTRADRIAMLS